MTHHDLLRSTLALVRTAGAAAALDALRRDATPITRPDGSAGTFHETLATFHVWAVDRLVAAGLSDAGVLWHPLTDAASPLAWYDAATLAGAESAARFVPSDRALPGEPAPVAPELLAAA